MKVDEDRIDRPTRCENCGVVIDPGVLHADGGEIENEAGERKMLCEGCQILGDRVVK